jgi:hypothetical protein
MSPEQATALVAAITGLIVALGVFVVQIRQVSSQLNGRLSQLLAVANAAAMKEGELAGRDFSTRSSPPIAVAASPVGDTLPAQSATVSKSPAEPPITLV